MEYRGKELLEKVKTIAVVGLSADAEKASSVVARYLESRGYNIIPVNPRYTSIMGKECYPSLVLIPENQPVDLVNVFRPSEEVSAVVEEALERGVPAVWMQEGIQHEESRNRAEAAGVQVVMDRCIKKHIEGSG